MNNETDGERTERGIVSERTGGLPILEGTIVGALAWFAGYAATHVLVASDVRESPLQVIIEAFQGAPATYEMVGWVFYNAHLVDTAFEDVPFLGSQTTTYIGGEDGFTVLLYLIPIGLLATAGLVLSQYHGASDPREGALAGVTVLPIYLLLSVAGTFAFEVSVGSTTGAPALLPAVIFAGILYPLLLAGAGGAVGGLLTRREDGTRAGNTTSG